MCDLSLVKGGKKKNVSEFLFQHQPDAIQDLGHFNVNINPFSHKLLKIILTSEGGDGQRVHSGFFPSSVPPKIK